MYTHTNAHMQPQYLTLLHIYSESEVTKKGAKNGQMEMTFNAFEHAHEQAKFVFFLLLFLSTCLLHQVNSCVHNYSTGKVSERVTDCLRMWMLWVLID